MPAAGPRATARLLWPAIEPVHAVVYFADEVRDALKAAGLRGFWMGHPWGRLWQACTTLREHRGDGHVAALVAEGLRGIDAHVLLFSGGGRDQRPRRDPVSQPDGRPPALMHARR